MTCGAGKGRKAMTEETAMTAQKMEGEGGTAKASARSTDTYRCLSISPATQAPKRTPSAHRTASPPTAKTKPAAANKTAQPTSPTAISLMVSDAFSASSTLKKRGQNRVAGKAKLMAMNQKHVKPISLQ